MARELRRLVNIRPAVGRRHVTVSIPTALIGEFDSDWVIVEKLPHTKGVSVRPASIKPKCV